jgi:hypothetical protein
LLSAFALRARSFKDMNLADPATIQLFWNFHPKLSRDHLIALREIRDDIDGVAWNYNTRTGDEVV